MTMNTSYSPSYLSIEDILATNERVPCKFLNELPNMGFMDPSSDEINLKAGASLELPFWLAENLVARRPPAAAPQLPRGYREGHREVLKAEASAVDLHRLSPFYYEFGVKLSPFDIRGDLGNSLVLTFRNRFRHIMDLSQNSEPDPLASARLERLERSLLAEGQAAARDLGAWCHTSRALLKPAKMVRTHRKRKLAALQE